MSFKVALVYILDAKHTCGVTDISKINFTMKRELYFIIFQVCMYSLYSFQLSRIRAILLYKAFKAIPRTSVNLSLSKETGC